MAQLRLRISCLSRAIATGLTSPGVESLSQILFYDSVSIAQQLLWNVAFDGWVNQL
ncbi:MAG: hypothetical protein WBB29_12125 [Geitlerinemataceae cyanobacterium]